MIYWQRSFGPSLPEPGAKGECGLATLLQTEAVRTGKLRDSPQLYGNLVKSSRGQ